MVVRRERCVQELLFSPNSCLRVCWTGLYQVIFSDRNVTEILTVESARQGTGFVRSPALDSVSSFQLSRSEQTEVKCFDGSVWTGTRPGAGLAMGQQTVL
jgi:hypothetical protein